jgi:C4-dicarboxylate-binding protein DctP
MASTRLLVCSNGFMVSGIQRQLAVIVALLVGITTTGCRQELAAEFRFRYAHEQPVGSLRSQSMRFFETELEKRSQGRIQVELYLGGVLGHERELMDFVATGALQSTRGGFFTDANPKFGLLMMPFLVNDWDQAIRLVNSGFVREINREAAKNGFHIPATGISQGFRAHTNNKRPLKHPDDLKGLKMRVPMQEVYVQTALAFEENPQELPYTEVYQALQTGVVDGQDNAPANIWDFKIHEVSKYLTLTYYATGPDPFMVNLDWYETLPVELKEVFDEVARETMALSDQLNRDKEEEYIDQLSAELETNIVSGDALQPFRQAVQPAYDYFIKKGDFSEEDVKRARDASKP